MSARRPRRPAVTSQGHYAGSVSRFLAYVDRPHGQRGRVRAGAGGHLLCRADRDRPFGSRWNRSNIVVAIIFVVWEFVYFGYSWAASGRTLRHGRARGARCAGRRRAHRPLARCRPRPGVPAQLPAASAWASSASSCSASIARCTISSPAPRSCTPGTPGPRACGSWPARRSRRPGNHPQRVTSRPSLAGSCWPSGVLLHPIDGEGTDHEQPSKVDVNDATRDLLAGLALKLLAS